MISIIVPTLDEQKVIAETLDRLRSQLTIPHEIIVSDGGSKDGTVEIARKLADKVVVHQGTTRQTIASGRNEGAKVAQGDFLVFLDADCLVPEPDAFFSAALSRFQAEPTLAGLTVYIRVFAETETLGDKAILGLMNFVVRLRNNMLKKGDCAGGEFQMVRKEAFRNVGGYREDLVTREDRDLFKRLAKIGRTMSDSSLVVFHSGRRAHAVGWPRLIGLFVANTLSFHLRGRMISKEWTVVR
ncbi:MAG: glycosyltransferase [Verrucomicrobiota bacterium]